MNNKKLGNDFEKEVCELLKQAGYWVHFISPDNRGAQPFDIIACKDNIPLVADCKTSVKKWFTMDRVEDNQAMAFEMWERCGNNAPMFLVKYQDSIKIIYWDDLKITGKINLEVCSDVNTILS